MPELQEKLSKEFPESLIEIKIHIYDSYIIFSLSNPILEYSDEIVVTKELLANYDNIFDLIKSSVKQNLKNQISYSESKINSLKKIIEDFFTK